MRRSRNSYIRAPRSVTLAPMGTPSRSLKFAIDFFAFVTTGLWPEIACRSAVAKSSTFAFSRPSPTPMLMTTFSRRGTWYGFVYPRSFMTAWTTVLWNISLSRGGVSPVPFGRPCATATAGAAAPAPFFAGAFGVVPDSFAMVSALVDRFAAALADTELASVGQRLDPAAHRPVASAADD